MWKPVATLLCSLDMEKQNQPDSRFKKINCHIHMQDMQWNEKVAMPRWSPWCAIEQYKDHKDHNWRERTWISTVMRSYSFGRTDPAGSTNWAARTSEGKYRLGDSAQWHQTVSWLAVGFCPPLILHGYFLATSLTRCEEVGRAAVSHRGVPVASSDCVGAAVMTLVL